MKRSVIIVLGILVLIVGGILAVTRLRQPTTNQGPNSSRSANHTSSKERLESQRAGKSLIIYFSISGSTKTAAEKIQAKTKADLIQIEPTTAYPTEYDDYVKVAQNQLRKKIHPEIKTKLPNLNQYETVFIGFPTWWQQPPMIVHSLFDQFDFSGKTIVPFTTSMSSPMSASMPTMRRLARADQAKIITGFRYNDNDQALAKFLTKNNLNKQQD